MQIRRAHAVCILAFAIAACDTGADETAPADDAADGQESRVSAAEPATQRFLANLAPVNQELFGSAPAGHAMIEIRSDSMVITVEAQGLPSDMMHLQHFHGFEDASSARCPGPDADTNDDGVVDVTETAPMAGTTMVPFHADPANMEIHSESYPRADGEGAYSYRHAVSLGSVRYAFQEKFGGDLALDRRVVFIHGIPEDAAFPESAATKAGLPVHVSIPIACGVLRLEE